MAPPARYRECVDGRVTPFAVGADQGHLQLPGTSSCAPSGEMILTALRRNSLFVSAACVAACFHTVPRYQGVQSFGNTWKRDPQVRGSGATVRTDLSATLFLADRRR